MSLIESKKKRGGGRRELEVLRTSDGGTRVIADGSTLFDECPGLKKVFETVSEGHAGTRIAPS
jgi:hypothetical protein